MRACGSCTACCTSVEVPELNKAACVPCAHLVPGGCGIYTARPTGCRDFTCAWLNDDSGHLRDEDRPDISGLVIGVTPTRPVVAVIEVRPKVFETYRAQKLISRLRKHYLLSLVQWGARSGGEGRWEGPAYLMREFKGGKGTG